MSNACHVPLVHPRWAPAGEVVLGLLARTCTQHRVSLSAVLGSSGGSGVGGTGTHMHTAQGESACPLSPPSQRHHMLDIQQVGCFYYYLFIRPLPHLPSPSSTTTIPATGRAQYLHLCLVNHKEVMPTSLISSSTDQLAHTAAGAGVSWKDGQHGLLALLVWHPACRPLNSTHLCQAEGSIARLACTSCLAPSLQATQFHTFVRWRKGSIACLHYLFGTQPANQLIPHTCVMWKKEQHGLHCLFGSHPADHLIPLTCGTHIPPNALLGL